MCPHCGSETPLVYRGPLAYCSACNRPRVPLSAAGVNLAGKPSKLGGAVASVVGWVVLAASLALAFVLGAVLQAIFPPGAMVGWVVGSIVAALGLGAATLLLLGGRLLRRTGVRATLGAQRDAIHAIARNQRGIVRSELVAGALGLSSSEAEAVLTQFSREPDSGVTLEVDDDGKLYYRLAAYTRELSSVGATDPVNVVARPVAAAKTEVLSIAAAATGAGSRVPAKVSNTPTRPNASDTPKQARTEGDGQASERTLFDEPADDVSEAEESSGKRERTVVT